MNITQMLRKYFIMGSQNCRPGEHPEIILRTAIEAGITAFQFREKGSGALVGSEKIALGKRLRDICHKHDIPFIINDDIELVNILEVDGIHVGQDDATIESLRKKFPKLFIGLSISNKDELAASPLNLVDYVGAGPIYSTETKTDAKQAVGLEWITYLRNKHPHLPVVGIGGIDETNAHEVLTAGANGVSVISAITNSDYITKTVSLL